MKISMVSYTDVVGGAYKAAYRIHQSLLESSIDSIMYCSRQTSGDYSVIVPPGSYFKNASFIRTYLSYLPSKLANYDSKALYSSALLPSKWPYRLNNDNSDLIHLHWINNEMLSIEDISKISKPIVWTLHDMWAFCGAEHYSNETRFIEGYHNGNRIANQSRFDLNKWVWKRKLESWKSPIEIVTPSRWLADCVKKSKLMCNWPITIIPYALDTEFWKPIEKSIARK